VNLKNTKSMYQIKIKGHLQEKWAEWFNGMIFDMMTSNHESNHTTMLMKVPDQAALRGILNKIWDLNLSLISVTLIENSTKRS
jgi:hypothetical protein